jgi:hypothetical protein
MACKGGRKSQVTWQNEPHIIARVLADEAISPIENIFYNKLITSRATTPTKNRQR